MQQALRPPGAPGQVGLVTRRCAFFQKDLFILHVTSSWTIHRETKPTHLQLDERGHPTRIRKTEGSSPDYTGVSPRGNSLTGGSISAVLRGHLTSVPGSCTLFPNNQTEAETSSFWILLVLSQGRSASPSNLPRGRGSIYQ